MSIGKFRTANRRWITPLSASILAMLTVVAYARVLSSWWLVDDPQIILHAVRNSVFESLFDPRSWRTLSSSNFTPLVTLSFEIDLALFRFEPAGYYAHQLASLTIAVLAFFFFLRRFTDDLTAFLGGGALVLSPAAGHAAGLLMLRHYVEGLALAIIVLILWDRGCLSGNDESAKGPPKGWTLAVAVIPAALFYLASVLAKEVFGPLPLLMIAISIGRREPGRRVAVRMVPVAVSAVVYLIWRWMALGSVGGYSEGAPASILESVSALWGAVTGPMSGWLAAVLLVVAAFVLHACLVRERTRTIAVALLVFAFAVIPLIPVLGSIVPRYGVIPSVLLIAVLVVGTRNLASRTVAVALLLLAGGVLFRGAILREREDRPHRESMIAEGKYVWTRDASAPTLLGGSPEWYVEGIADLRRLEGRGEPPGFALSVAAMSVGDLDPGEVVSLDSAGEPVPLGETVVARVRRDRKARDDLSPLSVVFRREGNDVHWELGPPCDCTWTYLSLPHYDDVSIASSGRRRLPEPLKRTTFRILRAESSGRWTVSPPLSFPDDGSVTRWSRSKGSKSSG